MTVVSSAYFVKIKSLLLNFIPFIFSFFFIFIAKISAQSIKMYGEIGSHCLQPRSVLKMRKDYHLGLQQLVCYYEMLISTGR